METVIKLLNKLSISILLVSLLFFVTDVCGQQRMSEQKITLNENQKSVKQILKSITVQTGMKFSYNPKIINDFQKTSVKISNTSPSGALKLLFEDTVSVKQVNNYIILSKNSTPKKENVTIPQKEHKISVQNEKSNLPQEENQIIFKEEKTIEEQDIKPENPIKEEKNQQTDIGKDTSDCHSLNKINNNDNMKKHLAALLVASTLLATDTLSAQQTTTQNDSNSISVETTENNRKSVPFCFSLVYPLGTDWIYSAQNQYNFSLSLTGGVSGKIKGVELAPAFNINLKGVKGAQFTAGFNIASAAYRKGAEVADYESNNAQFSTAFNFTRLGTSTQFTSGFNIADKAPFQASAGGNAAEQAHAQISAGVNFAKKSDVQIAAAINISDTTKVQISAGVNVSRESKFQASVVNVTKKGKAQIGIINVRDTADGVSIGLINIVRKGGVMEAGIEFGEFIMAAATFRSGIRPFYSILSIGYNASFGNDDWGNNMLVAGAGIGTTIRLNEKTDLNLELMSHNFIHKHNFFSESRSSHLSQFKAMCTYRFNKHLKLFAGPAFNLLHQNYWHYTTDLYEEPKWLEAPYSLIDNKINNKVKVKKSKNCYTKYDLWVGGTIGLRF